MEGSFYNFMVTVVPETLETSKIVFLVTVMKNLTKTGNYLFSGSTSSFLFIPFPSPVLTARSWKPDMQLSNKFKAIYFSC